jgi:DNA-directed RNA polymerase subunit RPC12/RpoP
MSGIEPEPTGISQYTMQIECPQCGAKMIVHVGLTGDPKNGRLECIACHSEIESLVPGQIVGGPFPATN